MRINRRPFAAMPLKNFSPDQVLLALVIAAVVAALTVYRLVAG
jgi:hypothetical protein